jgi:hypothetical protein
MSVHTLELEPAVSVATVLKVVKAPLKIPAWSVVVLLIMAGVYGYVSGRQNPVHHYVPYVGFPLVLDTTTGKACYSTTPKPSESAVNASYSPDGGTALPEAAPVGGPFIPMCEK